MDEMYIDNFIVDILCMDDLDKEGLLVCVPALSYSGQHIVDDELVHEEFVHRNYKVCQGDDAINY